MSADPSPRAEPNLRLAVPSLIAVIFINMMGFGIVVPLLPFFAKSFAAAPWQIALVFSAYSVGGFFGEPFWGRLSDRVGRKPILIWIVCGNCILYLALTQASNVWVAFAMRLVGGLTSGNASVVQGYLADATPPHRRSRNFSYVAAAQNVGLIVGPSIGGLFAHPSAGPIGFRIPLLIAAALSAVSAVSMALFVREPRARNQAISHRPSRWAALDEALASPVLKRLFALTFLLGLAFTGVESSFALWTQAKFGWGPPQVGVCFAFVGVAAAMTQMTLTGRLSERFGSAQMLACGMALILACALLQPFSTGAPAITTLMCGIAIGQSFALPNVGALISRSVDPHRQGQVLGLNNAGGALARILGPLCAAVGYSYLTIDAAFYQAAAVAGPAIWLALAVARRAPPLERHGPAPGDTSRVHICVQK